MSEKLVNNKIIVFGGSHHNSLGVVRSLGEKGIYPYVILVTDQKKSFVFKSKYVQEGWRFSTYEKAIQFILDNFSDNEQKPIIIATSDAASSIIDLNYNQLKENFIVPNGGEEGKLTFLMDKKNMGAIAENVGFDMAKTWVISDRESLSDIEYPCITKPISSIFGSKSEIKVCYDKDELADFLSHIDNIDRIQIQRYVDRDFEYQLIGCSLGGGCKVIIPGFTKIIRSVSTTNTGFLKYIPIKKLMYEHEKCVYFLQACNYSGLFSLEFIRGKDGKDYFLEINFRNDGNAYAVTAGGVNLPYIWIRASIGLDFDVELNNQINQVIIMPELVDILQVFNKKVSVKNWVKDVRRTNAFLYYDKKDMKPFYHELQKLIILACRKVPKVLFSKLKR